MATTTDSLLVTCALPYANGSLHIGHLVEWVQADIWVRFHKMQQRQCLFICGDDAHGTAIMLGAKQRGISPEQLIAEIHAEHKRDAADFQINFDNFYTTHSAENQVLMTMLYDRLMQGGDIAKRSIQQAYDPEENMFFARSLCKRGLSTLSGSGSIRG